MQSDYFGSAVEPENGRIHARPDSPTPSGPARKAQKRNSPASNASNDDHKEDDGRGAAGDASVDGNGGPMANGPPFICPTCSTSYSRLEYLRRHERRHGSGEGEKPAEGESPPKATKPRRSSSTAKPGRPKGSTKAAKAAAAAANNANGAGEGSNVESSAIAASSVSDGMDGPVPPPPAPHSDQLTHDAIAVAAAAAAAAAAAGHHPTSVQSQEEDASAMIDPAIAADSQAQAAAAATTVAAISSVAAYQYANSMDPPDFHMGRGAVNPYASASFPLPVHSAVAALHPQLYQPSSPESNQPRSEHGSPRYGGQTLARHGSNSGSRFPMGQAAYNQYAARSASSFANPADAAIWEGLDTAKLPSPGHVTTPGSAARATASMLASLGFPVTSPLSHLGDRSRADASYFRSTAPGLSGSVGAGSSSNLGGYGSNSANSPAFSFGTSASSNETGAASSSQSASNAGGASSTSQGQEAPGATTPKEPVRFSVSTLGPLSPFSNTALNSSMSPYLSAFSNARDTPLVSSPRSALPTTPGGGLASLDLGGQWTGMRPPSRTVSRHNSLQGINIFNTSASPQSEALAAVSKLGKSSSNEKLGLSDKADGTDGNDIKPSTSVASTTSSVPATSAATASEAHSAPSTDPTTSGVGTTTTSASVQSNNGGLDTPSRFVKNQSQQYFDGGALTPGPEAFLLRLQGGVQELRAGIHGSGISFLNGPSTALSSAPLGASQFSTPNWDHSMFSNPSAGGVAATASATPGSQLGALGWLMSPSIQSLLNAFTTTAGSGTVDATNASDYFNSKSIAAPNKADLDSVSVGTVLTPLEKALADPKNPFFVPPDMMRPCYSIPHWSLPPLTRLSVLALHAQQNLLKHFPVLHEPTFRIDTTPGCVAFAMCMLGGHEAGRKWWVGEEVVPQSAINIINSHVVSKPVSGLQRLMDKGPSRYVDEEDGQELVKPIVMSQKSEMLMRAFASRCKSVRDKCTVVQALMLVQSHNFLDSDTTTRMVAGVSHGTVVTLARQAGFFDPDAEHAQRKVSYTAEDVMQQVMFESVNGCFSYSFVPLYETEIQGEDKIWRRWAELEGRRRTAFVIFTMDTVAHLDAAVPTMLATKEIAHLPLPNPDHLWRASTAQSWNKALQQHKGLTLDEALHQLLSSDPGTSPPQQVSDMPSIQGSHGPFARLVMVFALLRGIVEMLEGRATKVAKPSSLTKWMKLSPQSNGPDSQVAVYKKALARWRKAWDADPTCRFASVKKPIYEDDMDTSPDGRFKTRWPDEAPQTLFTPLTASGATSLSDDALPIYWLAHVLVTHAASNQRLPLRSVEGRMGAQGKNGDYSVMGGGPEMPDFRAMLRFAKNFVMRGEK
uniref:C2h2 zinc finger protein zas1a n=1 Tax=Melanopsichium pennsylvanicum 4 TaxID=1398559 RepID=A0A077R3Y1_9BASI|nr:c2h2 zinc finger protein zas1a [Melanopsichium pennsylvanicum 4]